MKKNTSVDREIQFTPRATQIASAQLLLATQAMRQPVERIVTGHKRNILAKGQWMDDGMRSLHGDADFEDYKSQCKQMREKFERTVENQNHCTLLLADDVITKAKQILVEEMEKVTNITWAMLLNQGIEELDQYVQLSLNLLAPHCVGNFSPSHHHWLLSWRDHARNKRAEMCGYETGPNICNRPGRSGMAVMDCVSCESGTEQNRFAVVAQQTFALTRSARK